MKWKACKIKDQQGVIHTSVAKSIVKEIHKNASINSKDIIWAAENNRFLSSIAHVNKI